MIEQFKDKTPNIAGSAFVHQTASVIGDVTLGENASIWCGAVLRGDMNSIYVGENSNVQDNATLHIALDNKVIIGKDVTIGHNAVVHGATIGDNTLIGMGAIILDNVVIGKNCIIGAGALITSNQVIPDNSVVVGNPFKIIKQTTAEQVKMISDNAEEYVKLSKEFTVGAFYD